MHVKLITNKTNLLAFKDLIDDINLDENSIIIVPDKFSLSSEQMFFEQKNILSNFSTRVFSLTKLASVVLESELINKKIIDKNISLMIISSIIEENLSNFKYFTNIKDINHISEDIFSVISQFLSSNVYEVNNDIDEILKDKFYDLNIVMQEYLKRRENYLVDASIKYDLFIEKIKDSDFIKNHTFYFGMFNSLTNQVKCIIKEITKTAKSVVFSTSKSENRINNNEIYDFYNSLKVNEIIKGKNKLNGVANFVVDNFFNSNRNKYDIKNNEIKLFEMKTIEDEIENLVVEIKKDTILNGYRYKDISICVSNLNTYKDIIKKEFDKQNYSYFIDENISLIENGYANFIIDLISILDYSNNKKMLGLVKNYYIDIEENIKNNYENFLYKYSINEFAKLDNFNQFKNDEFYNDYKYVYDNIVCKIYDFKEQIKNIININDFFRKFNELLKSFNSIAKLNEKIDFYRDNDILKFKQYIQIENKVFECEKNICEYYNEKFNIKKLLNFMRLCFNNTSISVPATSVDSIYIGDFINSYFKPCKKIYIIGCDSKNFPNLKQDVSLFTDNELKRLEKKSQISPKVLDANRVNYYKCFQTLLGFTDSIFLSYSLLDDKGNKNFPSNIFKNFVNRFTKNGKNILIEKNSVQLLNFFEPNEILTLLSYKFNSKEKLLKYFYSLEDCKAKNIVKYILENYHDINFSIKEEEKIDKNLINQNNFTASNLETYFSCSNKFLFREILKLKKFDQIKLDAKTIGNIIHKCCYLLGKALIDKKSIDSIAINEIIKNTLNSKEFNFIYFIENSKQIIENIKFEISKLFDFILKQQTQSEFKLSKVEYKFTFEENGINFKGFVDRIDENENEFIIIDYKTGNTKIEYKDIVFNKKIQLILYAIILEKILNKKCVGIYYLSVNDDFSKNLKMKIFLNGITVNENNNIFKLDKSSYYEKTLQSDFFEFKDKYLLTYEKFEKIKDYTFKQVLNGINEIKSGEFSGNPIFIDEQDICEYCDYYEICKNKNIRKVEFTEDLIREVLDD